MHTRKFLNLNYMKVYKLYSKDGFCNLLNAPFYIFYPIVSIVEFRKVYALFYKEDMYCNFEQYKVNNKTKL